MLQTTQHSVFNVTGKQTRGAEQGRGEMHSKSVGAGGAQCRGVTLQVGLCVSLMAKRKDTTGLLFSHGWVGKLNHIAIATRDAAEHVKFFRDVMRLPVSERKVEDIAQAVKHLKEKGITPLSPPKIGAHGNPVVFLHPKDCQGILTELEQVASDNTRK
ncbi:putative gynecophoral canal protein [Paramicrosporidium saccamoebae]|uniref:Putative gynecophoral canal protein n=1 Tax=Paramicrosporidium saccamoebae TaxID=1246581 RepID=A0A2H9TMB6_9FUNG|nr:putative gynecophoral canal protein [Paramicrosporidium saccamoebae]